MFLRHSRTKKYEGIVTSTFLRVILFLQTVFFLQNFVQEIIPQELALPVERTPVGILSFWTKNNKEEKSQNTRAPNSICQNGSVTHPKIKPMNLNLQLEWWASEICSDLAGWCLTFHYFATECIDFLPSFATKWHQRGATNDKASEAVMRHFRPGVIPQQRSPLLVIKSFQRSELRFVRQISAVCSQNKFSVCPSLLFWKETGLRKFEKNHACSPLVCLCFFLPSELRVCAKDLWNAGLHGSSSFCSVWKLCSEEATKRWVGNDLTCCSLFGKLRVDDLFVSEASRKSKKPSKQNCSHISEWLCAHGVVLVQNMSSKWRAQP